MNILKRNKVVCPVYHDGSLTDGAVKELMSMPTLFLKTLPIC